MSPVCTSRIACCLVALALVSGTACRAEPGPASTEALLHRALPSLELAPWFHTEPADLGRGSTWVVLELWAHWCGPCLQSIRLLAPWAASHPNVRLVAVNIQREEEVGDLEAARFVEAADGAPVLYRGGPAARRALGADVVPTLLLVDPEGVVRAVHRGGIDDSTLAAWERTLH